MPGHCPACCGVFSSIEPDGLTLRDCPGCQECERLRAKLDQWKDRANNAYRASIGEVWHWQGDEGDHPESLTCPVLMSAEQVREFIAMRTRLDIADRVIATRSKIADAQEGLRDTCSTIGVRVALKAVEDANIEYAHAVAEWEEANG